MGICKSKNEKPDLKMNMRPTTPLSDISEEASSTSAPEMTAVATNGPTASIKNAEERTPLLISSNGKF
jgi:hypothetical protein